MKKLGIIGLAAVIFIGFFTFRLLGNLDSIVEETIEKIGTELTGTRVELEGVEIDLATGSATLRGLKIENPDGYKSGHAFLLKKISVGLDLKSLSGPVIVINEVIIRGADLNVEQRGERNNLSDLLAQVEANSKKSNAGAAKEPTPESGDVRLALKKLVFADTQATLIGGTSENKSIKVPDVKRSNIGSPQKGLTPEQLGNALLQAVLEEVESAVSIYLADLAKQALTDKVREKIGFPSREK
jgi:uncharacterized protein involved in outer membrane biogenesis